MISILNERGLKPASLVGALFSVTILAKATWKRSPQVVQVLMRKIILTTGETYHIYNRGTDKRNVFLDQFDLDRFKTSIKEFNTEEPIGSIFENKFRSDKKAKKISKKLVKIICCCLNQNHFHFLLTQLQKGGISKFMHRLGSGYTSYFNIKYRRSGSLFQGVFKAAHISNNDDLLRMSVYVNLNDKIHKLRNTLGDFVPKSKNSLSWSTWKDYSQRKKPVKDWLCQPDLILDQFDNLDDYKSFAGDLLPMLIEKKKEEKESKLLIE